MQSLGTQILVEFYGCAAEILNDAERIRAILLEGTIRSGAIIVQEVFHTFSPYGVSGVVVIAESHVAIHTWPEYGYAAMDIFTCGHRVDPWIIQSYVQIQLGAVQVSSMEFKRGMLTVDTPAPLAYPAVPFHSKPEAVA
jgi:S-adenosylmethionine decarboxylase proenzyme